MRWLAAAAFATLATAFPAAADDVPAAAARHDEGVESPGELAAELRALRVIAADGSTRSLGEVVGNGTALVAFWATYCPPCRLEVPLLSRERARLERQGIRVLGVATDGSDPGRVAAAVADWGIGYETLRVAPQQAERLEHLLPRGLPASFLVGDGGALRHDALLADEAALDALLRRRPGGSAGR